MSEWFELAQYVYLLKWKLPEPISTESKARICGCVIGIYKPSIKKSETQSDLNKYIWDTVGKAWKNLKTLK